MPSCDSMLEVYCTQLLSISMAASLSLKIWNLLLKRSRITAPQRNQDFFLTRLVCELLFSYMPMG